MTLAAFADWFTAPWPALGGALVSSVAAFVLIILFVRVFGVRSFAKMSGFDFAMTIAMGSVLASAAMSKSVPLPVAGLVLAVMFVGQWTVARLRLRFPAVGRLVDNRAILVMAEGQFLDNNLRRSGVTRDELIGKLREANVLEIRYVRAVVVETTGDVSVLHGEPSVPLAEELLENVRDGERFGDFGPQTDGDGDAA